MLSLIHIFFCDIGLSLTPHIGLRVHNLSQLEIRGIPLSHELKEGSYLNSWSISLIVMNIGRVFCSRRQFILIENQKAYDCVRQYSKQLKWDCVKIITQKMVAKWNSSDKHLEDDI